MDKVSIITINFNHRRGLQHTIESVIAQTYPFIEYIVIDGGSTDGSRDLLEHYEKHITYWVSEKDGGIYEAMNKGAGKATGEYLLFLNSGDYLSSSRVIQSVFQDRHTADLLIGRQLYIDHHNRTSKSPKLHISEIGMKFFLSSTLPHQSTFIKRELLEKIGGYRIEYRVSADWVFWIQAVVENCCSLEILPLSVSYMEAGGISTDMKKCHADMANYLNVLLKRGVLPWDDIFDLAIEARSHEFCCRNALLGFLNRLMIKIGKRL